ncbi:MAG: strawberry notch C-terminal domain-containing protein, partial [Acetobacteraceae bacterium]
REELPPITQFLNRVLALRIGLQNTLFAVFEELLDARIEAAIAIGAYDAGVETLSAESFRIAERRTVHTHAATGAETRCYRVLRRDRNRPLPLADALKIARAPGARLLVNTQSGRAAVQVPTASVMRDDGSVEARVRLIRPMTRETVALDELAHSHWEPVLPERFAQHWEAECARIPEFSESTFHIVTGLLLPVWDRLPAGNMRVYRFETDEGERVIGRMVTAEALAQVYEGLGVEGAPGLSAGEAWQAVLERGAVLNLAGGLQIRRALVMGTWRAELTGFSEGAVPQLKALGLTSEIIAWRLRLFLLAPPERAPILLASLFERHPLLRVHARAAAA